MDTAKVLGHAYRPRVIDAALQRALAASGAVVIEGSRASGKTMTAMHAAGLSPSLTMQRSGVCSRSRRAPCWKVRRRG